MFSAIQPYSWSYVEAKWYATKNTIYLYEDQFVSFLGKRIEYICQWITPPKQENISASTPTCPSDLNEEEKVKFFSILQKIEVLKARFSISAPLQITYEKNVSSPWVSPSEVCFGKELLHMDDASINFVLIHEFSHIKLGHLELKEHFHYVLSIVEIISFFVFFPLLIPIEVISFFIAGNLWRKAELEADAAALHILGSADGAKQFFSQMIQQEKHRILSKMNLDHLNEGDRDAILCTILSSSYGYSHPTLFERQNQVEKIARSY